MKLVCGASRRLPAPVRPLRHLHGPPLAGKLEIYAIVYRRVAQALAGAEMSLLRPEPRARAPAARFWLQWVIQHAVQSRRAALVATAACRLPPPLPVWRLYLG